MRLNPSPTVVYAPVQDLFAWARTEAAAIAEALVTLNNKRLELATVTLIVEQSGEYGEVEEAKERLKKARDAALDCDAVLHAKNLLAKAKSALKAVAATGKAKSIAADVKALAAVVNEGKSRLAHGLATGRGAE